MEPAEHRWETVKRGEVPVRVPPTGQEIALQVRSALCERCRTMRITLRYGDAELHEYLNLDTGPVGHTHLAKEPPCMPER